MRSFMPCLFLFFFLLSFVPGTGVDGVGDDIKNIIIMLCCVLFWKKVTRALVDVLIFKSPLITYDKYHFCLFVGTAR